MIFFYNIWYTCMLGYPVFGCFWWILRLFTPPHFPILKGTILSSAPGFVSRDTVNVRIRYTEALSSYNHRSSPVISATINLAVQPTPCPGAKGTRTDRRWKRRICPPLLCLFPNKSTSKSVRLEVEKYEKKNKMPSETSAMETFGPGIPVPQASTCKQSSFWFAHEKHLDETQCNQRSEDVTAAQLSSVRILWQQLHCQKMLNLVFLATS